MVLYCHKTHNKHENATRLAHIWVKYCRVSMVTCGGAKPLVNTYVGL